MSPIGDFLREEIKGPGTFGSSLATHISLSNVKEANAYYGYVRPPKPDNAQWVSVLPAPAWWLR
ncbi:hypothetical protein M378DRAFT_17224 [Amanita muscaria Koide BX008]|uniref:Uncharacterized protein n=1 Tax=Amanita muscaria (strain Koide BX008) TaxID=946122 RepID=A0A0C2S0X0_AMAMK|nr:hypothetical protein M378DRAFT_17224 [Amanita muscaria Koide BX008]